MAGGFYYLLQQCGTLNTAIGSSSNSGLVGSFYYDSVNLICWEVTGPDFGPLYTVDIDTLLGILDCSDPLCSSITPTPTPTPPPTPTQLAIQYNITSFGYATTNDACASLDAVVAVYAPPGYTTPIVGMIFYDDTSLTIPHNGGF